MSRKSFTKKQRIEIFTHHKGICHICGGEIQTVEAWECEHIIPVQMGGTNDIENVKPAHVKCHKDKTKEDVSNIARAKRREGKHKGFIRPKQTIKSRGFDHVKKQSLIDKSKLKFGV